MTPLHHYHWSQGLHHFSHSGNEGPTTVMRRLALRKAAAAESLSEEQTEVLLMAWVRVNKFEQIQPLKECRESEPGGPLMARSRRRWCRLLPKRQQGGPRPSLHMRNSGSYTKRGNILCMADRTLQIFWALYICIRKFAFTP